MPKNLKTIYEYFNGYTREQIDKMLENAKKESERIKRDSILETKEEVHKLVL